MPLRSSVVTWPFRITQNANESLHKHHLLFLSEGKIHLSSVIAIMKPVAVTVFHEAELSIHGFITPTSSSNSDIDNLSDSSSDAVCDICHERQPPSQRRSISKWLRINWVGCDSCDRWFHQGCTELKKNPDVSSIDIIFTTVPPKFCFQFQILIYSSEVIHCVQLIKEFFINWFVWFLKLFWSSNEAPLTFDRIILVKTEYCSHFTLLWYYCCISNSNHYYVIFTHKSIVF